MLLDVGTAAGIGFTKAKSKSTLGHNNPGWGPPIADVFYTPK